MTIYSSISQNNAYLYSFLGGGGGPGGDKKHTYMYPFQNNTSKQ